MSEAGATSNGEAMDRWDTLARAASRGTETGDESLALRQLLTFQIDGAPYAVPVERVREIVRIRPQTEAREPLGSRIEDPWRVFACDDGGDGCRVEFEDSEYSGFEGEAVYYARAIQEPTLAVNAGGLRCESDSEGRCIEVHPCYGDDRTDPSDDCLADNEEHAWSSPIWILPPTQASENESL